jgi:ribosomal protein S18 acetylase RimI-like enzyme
VNLSRSHQVLKRHGFGAAVSDLAARACSRATGFDTLLFLAWSFSEGLDGARSPSRAAWLGREELAAHALDPELDLSQAFIDETLDKGHVVAGIVEDGRLVSYEVFAFEPTVIPEGLVVTFPPPFAYAYKAFTRPDARGRGLHGEVTRFAARGFAAESMRGMVAYVRAINHASLTAFRRLGFQTVGYALVSRELRGVAIQPPVWARRRELPTVRLVPAHEASCQPATGVA